MKNNFKRILAAVLCLCTVLASAVLFASCRKEEEPQLVTAVRFAEKIEAGQRVYTKNLYEVTVDAKDLPEGAVNTLDEVFNGKFYLTSDAYPDDYLLRSRTSENPPEKEVVVDTTQKRDPNYLSVAAHVPVGTKTKAVDCADALQKLINDNPGRTLYFPDGYYYFTKPIKTSNDPAKTVSFKLSTYAVLVVDENNWTGGNLETALIQFGALGAAPAGKENDVGNSILFTGGVVDCNGKASAFSFEGSTNVTVDHTSVREAYMGFHIKPGATNVDIDSITMTGAKGKSLCALVEGSGNTLNNIRVCDIHIGIKATAGGNVMRNLHPLHTNGRDGTDGSVGFWDLSREGNFYDYCYSDQFPTGFLFENGSASILNVCFAFWYSEYGMIHYGVHSKDEFNAVIRSCRFDMCHPDKVTNAYLRVDKDGGMGIILDPYGVNHREQTDEYWSHFKKYEVNMNYTRN